MSNIVITGAGSGLGKSIALHFAANGDTICAVDRDKENLEKLVKQYPENISTYFVDISESDMVRDAFSAIYKDHGSIDVLVNNAGIHMNGEFADVEYDLIDKMIDVNIKGMLYCTRAAIPKMIENKSGHIINISSVAGLRGVPKRSLYIASKHAMVGFGDALAQELLPHGVLLVTLCPGGIATPLWDAKTNPYPGESEKLIKPDDIADLIDYILKQPKNILFKKLVFFPTSEWHSV